MTVLGIERNVVIDFKTKDGRKVHLEGLRLHLGEKKDNVEGMAVDKPLFISNERDCYDEACALALNDEVKVYYNRFGTFESIDKN